MPPFPLVLSNENCHLHHLSSVLPHIGEYLLLSSGQISVAWDTYLSGTQQENSLSFQSCQLCQPSLQPDKLKDPEPKWPWVFIHHTPKQAPARKLIFPLCIPYSVRGVGGEPAWIQTGSVTPAERGKDSNSISIWQQPFRRILPKVLWRIFLIENLVFRAKMTNENIQRWLHQLTIFWRSTS